LCEPFQAKGAVRQARRSKHRIKVPVGLICLLSLFLSKPLLSIYRQTAINHSDTKIDYPKEPNKSQKNTLKEEIPENFTEMLLNKVNKMYRRHLRNSKKIKIKNMRRHKSK
jgi:hypothetical protein